ncbi:hypothetical protein [Achromobacter dolens]|uniref:hypothetical protein n=1 Tax=Achromobacter dolens TaxID=1287738 RepID=UPI001466F597|nr:hypothetical protein [Achromobacter dolens]CAB3628307.1 hypothetical protein LMG26840_00459 [Achromobacter dolens]
MKFTDYSGGPVSVLVVQNAIVAGIKKAAGAYPKISGLSLDAAPEYFLTTSIAVQVGRLGVLIDLEKSVKETLINSGAISTGVVPKDIRGNGRFDMVVHKKNEKPRFLVEVKHPVGSFHRIERDVKRLSAVLARGGERNCLQSGFLALFVRKNVQVGAEDRLNRLLDEIGGRCQKLVEKQGQRIILSSIAMDKGSAYASAAVCIRIDKASRKKTK